MCLEQRPAKCGGPPLAKTTSGSTSMAVEPPFSFRHRQVKKQIIHALMAYIHWLLCVCRFSSHPECKNIHWRQYHATLFFVILNSLPAIRSVRFHKKRAKIWVWVCDNKRGLGPTERHYCSVMDQKHAQAKSNLRLTLAHGGLTTTPYRLVNWRSSFWCVSFCNHETVIIARTHNHKIVRVLWVSARPKQK